ncbi:hypothetical protein BDR26DRAFT_849145 [Obelidium mucronatum]|nr:hypothetical protein BDR26DRAFT_849145 [Obelidium mucronatum]
MFFNLITVALIGMASALPASSKLGTAESPTTTLVQKSTENGIEGLQYNQQISITVSADWYGFDVAQGYIAPTGTDQDFWNCADFTWSKNARFFTYDRNSGTCYAKNSRATLSGPSGLVIRHKQADWNNWFIQGHDFLGNFDLQALDYQSPGSCLQRCLENNYCHAAAWVFDNARQNDRCYLKTPYRASQNLFAGSIGAF